MRRGMVYTIRDLPLSERPRERLIKYGSGALSEAELLAIILRTGSRNESVLDLSKRILKDHALRDIAQMGISELKRYRGINDAKACQLAACAELSMRIYSEKSAPKERIGGSRDVFNLIYPELRFSKKEHFYCIFLDTRNCVIGKELLSVGNLNTSVVHPREIFQSAIKHGANSVVLVHNHPSGDSEPSAEDLEVTKMLIKAGEIMGMPIVDHVVIGDNAYTSMVDKSLISR